MMLLFRSKLSGDEGDSTFAESLADHEWLTTGIQAASGKSLDLRGAVMAFTMGRHSFHAAPRYAVFTSIEGFAEENAVFISDRKTESPSSFELIFVRWPTRISLSI